MPNSALSGCTLPAERSRGVVFAQDFRDRPFLARDGWTLYNSPSFRMPRRGGGVELNGTNQYLTRPLNGELNNSELTIEIEFWPDFTGDDGGQYQFIDASGGGGRTTLVKTSGNALQVYAGATTLVLNSAYATWGTYWIQGGKNIITLVLASGTNYMYLNGNQIATSVTAWTPQLNTTLYIGRSIALGSPFDGAISRFKIGHYLATEQEHEDAWNQTAWNWSNHSDVTLQMRTRDYDPTNVRTLDSSGNGNHFTLGNGSTSTTYPVQQKGYMSFDGVADYLRLASLAIDVNKFSICATVKATDAGGIYCVVGHGPIGASNYFLACVNGQWNFYTGNTGGGSRSYTVSSNRWPGIHSLVGVWDGTNAVLYFDGEEQVAAATPVMPAAGTSYVVVGKRADASTYYWPGNIYDVRQLNGIALTPTQVFDYHHQVMSLIGSEN